MLNRLSDKMLSRKIFIIVVALGLVVLQPYVLRCVRAEEIKPMVAHTDVATLGGGCFWCIEAIFQRLEGVSKVESGYSGGERKNPSYEQVSAGATGHAEVVQVTFDPTIISFADLLDVFFHLHDPTTVNQQGADHGPQYRSVIFFHNAEQEKIAKEAKEKIAASGLWKGTIVTEISPFKEFYPAENYHQNYYNEHKAAPYCSVVIAPKIAKLFKEYGTRLKKN